MPPVSISRNGSTMLPRHNLKLLLTRTLNPQLLQRAPHHRNFHTSSPTHNLFGSNPQSKSLRGRLSSSPEHLLKPLAKTQVSSNPADMLTQNDILMYSSKPQNYIESIKLNGFHLSNQYFVSSPDSNGDLVGLCLIKSETFEVKLTNKKEKKMNSVKGKGGLSSGDNCILDNHIVTFTDSILQIFAKVHPKPELVVIGTGKKTSRLLNPENRKWFSNMGIQLEVSDSTTAGQIYDLLSTERPGVIGALLLPPNL